MDDYPDERPGIALPVMAIGGLLILGLGVLVAWLLSGPDLKPQPTPDPDEIVVVSPDRSQPGSGLEVRRAQTVEPQNEQVARAVPIDPNVQTTMPSDPGEQVLRALPVESATSPEPAAGTTVTAPAQVDVRLDAGENAAVQREVLRRVDAMPNLTSESKDKLYAQVNRTRGMGKLATINFGVGDIKPSPAAISELRNVLQQAQAKPFADDPTVVFVVLGYADSTGDPAKNLQISLQRADSVVTALRDDLSVQNISHAVGMGGSNFLDPAQEAKNRAVEVWAVLP